MIGKLRDLKSVQMLAKDKSEPLSLYRSLSEHAGIKSLLVHHEVLEPGHRASGAHYHSSKEEITLVLSGKPSVWIEGKLFELEPGDFVGFNVEKSRAHMLINTSDEPAVLLTIGTNPKDEVATFIQVEYTG